MGQLGTIVFCVQHPSIPVQPAGVSCYAYRLYEKAAATIINSSLSLSPGRCLDLHRATNSALLQLIDNFTVFWGVDGARGKSPEASISAKYDLHREEIVFWAFMLPTGDVSSRPPCTERSLALGRLPCLQRETLAVAPPFATRKTKTKQNYIHTRHWYLVC